MTMYYGETLISVRVDVAVEAESQEAAERLVKGLSVDVDYADGVDVQGHDQQTKSIHLFPEE